MVENQLVESLDEYIKSGTRAERQLAQLAKDLIHLTGETKVVADYINQKAAETLAGESPWG